MVGDGIKAARIQARYSPLIGLTWEPVSFPVNIAAAIKNATTRLNPHRGRRPAGTPRQAGTPRRGARFSAGTRRTDPPGAVGEAAPGERHAAGAGQSRASPARCVPRSAYPSRHSGLFSAHFRTCV